MNPLGSRDNGVSQRKGVLLAAFFERLREAMKLRGMTQTELARQLGAGDATVSEWFTRGRVPLADVMLLLPEVLDVSGHWLLTGEGPREIPRDSHPDLYRLGARDALAEVERTLEELKDRHGIRAVTPVQNLQG